MPDDTVTTKSAIIERNQRAAAAMNTALGRLTTAQMLAPGAVGDWSLRDTLSHIANHWFPTQLEAHLEGRDPTPTEAYGTPLPPGPEFNLASLDDRNAWLYQVRKDQPLPQVRERYIRFLERMDRLIESLPESEFAVPYSLDMLDWVGRLHPAAEAEEGFPLWQWIRGEYWHHLENHLPAFEAAASEQ